MFANLHTTTNRQLQPSRQRQRTTNTNTFRLHQDRHQHQLQNIPRRTRMAHQLPQRTSFVLFSTLFNGQRSHSLPFTPQLPVLRVITNLGTRPLRTITLTNPIRSRLLRQHLSHTNVRRPTTRRFFTHLRLTQQLRFSRHTINTQLRTRTQHTLNIIHHIMRQGPLRLNRITVLHELHHHPNRNMNLQLTNHIRRTRITRVNLLHVRLRTRQRFRTVPQTFTTRQRQRLHTRIHQFFLDPNQRHRTRHGNTRPARIRLLARSSAPSNSTTNLSTSNATSTHLNNGNTG